MTGGPRPATARAAPPRLGAVQAQSAEMTRPPSQAPAALARLKADWSEAVAIVGASFASITGGISTGVVSESMAPMKGTGSATARPRRAGGLLIA